jgi:hypothetical protein
VRLAGDQEIGGCFAEANHRWRISLMPQMQNPM